MATPHGLADPLIVYPDLRRMPRVESLVLCVEADAGSIVGGPQLHFTA